MKMFNGHVRVQNLKLKILKYFSTNLIQSRNSVADLSKKVPSLAELEQQASKSEKTMRKNIKENAKSKRSWSYDFYNKPGDKGEMPGVYKLMFYGAAVGYLFWRTLHLEATLEGKNFNEQCNFIIEKLLKFD